MSAQKGFARTLDDVSPSVPTRSSARLPSGHLHDSRPQEHEAGPAVHLSLDHLESVHVAFYWTVAPTSTDRRLDDSPHHDGSPPRTGVSPDTMRILPSPAKLSASLERPCGSRPRTRRPSPTRRIDRRIGRGSHRVGPAALPCDVHADGPTRRTTASPTAAAGPVVVWPR